MKNCSSALVVGTRNIVVNVTLIEAFGMCAAMLIQQIHFWTSSSPKQREGHAWCYNTAKEWEGQIRGFGQKTIYRALKELERQGVVVTGRYNKSAYDRTKWYRLDYAKLVVVLSEFENCTWTLQEHPTGQKGQIHLLKMSQPIPEKNPEKKPEKNNTSELKLAVITNVVVEEIVKTSSEKPEGKSKAGKSKEGKTGEAMKSLPKKQIVKQTLSEVMAGGSLQHSTGVTPTQLPFVWKAKMKVIAGQFQKPLTTKEAAQLKTFGKFVGEDAVAVLDYALNNWMVFAQGAMYAAGLASNPLEPNVGFLLKHCGVAKNMYLQSIAKNVKIGQQTLSGETASYSAPVFVIPAGVQDDPDEAPYKPSPEEMLANLQALGD